MATGRGSELQSRDLDQEVGGRRPLLKCLQMDETKIPIILQRRAEYENEDDDEHDLISNVEGGRHHPF